MTIIQNTEYGFYEVFADEGKVLVNETVKTTSTHLVTPSSTADGWIEMNEADVPSWDEDDDIPAEEALDILTGVSE